MFEKLARGGGGWGVESDCGGGVGTRTSSVTC